MAVKDIFKISRKTFFNPTAWLGTHEISGYTRLIGSTLKTAFTPDKTRRVETFEQALERLNVTETDLQRNAQRYQLYAWVFIALSAGSILASFYYLFHHGTFAGWCLAMVVAALLAANAFKFDFWHFQIKYRKLGCTVEEWWRGKLNDEGQTG